MNAIETVREAEIVIAGLSKSERRQLLKRLSGEFAGTPAAVEKNSKVMGGAACIRGTRIPVWMLYQAREQSVSEADLLKNYPGLTAEDLVNAWEYAVTNRAEIEKQIAENELED